MSSSKTTEIILSSVKKSIDAINFNFRAQNLVLKIGFYNPYMEESVEKYDPFKREILFFQNILPIMNKMFQSLHSYPVTCK